MKDPKREEEKKEECREEEWKRVENVHFQSRHYLCFLSLL